MDKQHYVSIESTTVCINNYLSVLSTLSPSLGVNILFHYKSCHIIALTVSTA
jgi:hypothetical protein